MVPDRWGATGETRLKAHPPAAELTQVVEVLSPAALEAESTAPAPERVWRLDGVGRVWLLSVSMMVVALGLYLGAAQDIGRDPAAPFALPWWALALGFFATETNVVRVRYRDQAQSIPLNELPLVLGLVFASPVELLLGLLLGSTAALLRRRSQSPLQLAFNTSHFFLAGVVATLVFHRAAADVRLGPTAWSGALVAAVLVTLIGHAAITLATVLSGSQPQVDRLRQVLSLGLTSSITVTTIALAAGELLWRDGRTGLLLAVPALIGFLVYRASLEHSRVSGALDVVFESTRMLNRSPEVDAAVVALLTQARGMFRAERAEITLYPDGDADQVVRTTLGPGPAVEAMLPVALDADELAWAEGLPDGDGVLYPAENGSLVSPLADRGIHEAMAMTIRHGDRVAATILVGNRVGELDHFDRADLEVFEPLARNLGAVLESGALEQSVQQLRDLEAQLRHQAYHDPLTALANRSQFIERVELALEFSMTDTSQLAVLFIGVDDFKVVNDTLGHPVGDQLLVALAGRIRKVLGPEDAAARLGGDEFGVLLGCPRPEFAEEVAGALLDAIRAPLTVEGQELQVRASIGIAMGDSGRWADELLRNADVAMATAKASGKNCVRRFHPDMHVAVLERHELIADLQRAVERDEFEMHYQPIIELATGRIVALESLIRWNHPRRGLVRPDEFIPVAEETGLILPIGRMTLQKACAQAKAWQEQLPGHADLCVGVNLSARQLKEASFVGDTMQVIAESGIKPSTLILEITETVLMDDTESHIAKLGQLKSMGLRLAMDDFGTGYSSLSFLSLLPVDILKIAKPFVEGLGHSARDLAFASAIVQLGQTVGMSLIAEGVERPDQLEELRRLGCDMVQGWYFAKAMPAAEAEAMLADGVEPKARKVIPFPA
jgi:diguanylate cyclase (GGDEF)-like protein